LRSTLFRALAAALLAGALVLAAGCGDEDSDAGATASGDAQGDFPVTVESEQGEVTIDARPERIVSLSASLTEMLYAVGAGDQVVAVDRFSDYPEGTPTTDLSGLRPNVEAIAGYDPDLVVLANDRDGVVAAIEALGVPVLLLPSADRVRDVYREIEVVGAATGHADGAAGVNDEIRAELDEIAASAPERDEPVTYFYELSDTFHSVTSDTFIGELLGLVGLVSIADEADPAAGGFPQLSAEYVLEADPDVVFLAHTDGTTPTPAEVAARPGWDQLDAVEDGRVVVLDTDIAARWGPRIPELLQAAVDATEGVPR
jgi:iron complex transport system substrate-binding protein